MEGNDKVIYITICDSSEADKTLGTFGEPDKRRHIARGVVRKAGDFDCLRWEKTMT